MHVPEARALACVPAICMVSQTKQDAVTVGKCGGVGDGLHAQQPDPLVNEVVDCLHDIDRGVTLCCDDFVDSRLVDGDALALRAGRGGLEAADYGRMAAELLRRRVHRLAPCFPPGSHSRRAEQHCNEFDAALP